MSIQSIKLYLLPMALPWLLVACTFLRETIGLGPVPPRVSLVSLHIKNLSLQTVDVQGTFEIDNPNAFDIKFASLNYLLQVAGRPVALGKYQNPITIEAKKAAQVRLPFAISMKEILFVIKQLFVEQKKLDALLTATATFDTPIGHIDVDFQDSKPLY